MEFSRIIVCNDICGWYWNLYVFMRIFGQSLLNSSLLILNVNFCSNDYKIILFIHKNWKIWFRESCK